MQFSQTDHTVIDCSRQSLEFANVGKKKQQTNLQTEHIMWKSITIKY